MNRNMLIFPHKPAYKGKELHSSAHTGREFQCNNWGVSYGPDALKYN